MDRSKALFRGSRLYRQALEGSEIIINNIIKKEDLYEEIIKKLSGTSNVIISKNSDVDKLKKEIEINIDRLQKKISSYHGIPILIEAYAKVYYKNLAQLRWLGTSLKTAIANLWGSFITGKEGHLKALGSIEELLINISFLEELEKISLFFELYGEEEVVVTKKGNKHGSREFNRKLYEHHQSFKTLGRRFRTREVILQRIWSRTDVALDAIQEILKGKPVSTIGFFKDTFLEKISGDNVEFWLGLWVRLCTAYTQLGQNAPIYGNTQVSLC